MIYSREIRIVLHIIDSIAYRYATDALFCCNANVAAPAIKTSGVNVALPLGEGDHILGSRFSVDLNVLTRTHTRISRVRRFLPRYPRG